MSYHYVIYVTTIIYVNSVKTFLLLSLYCSYKCHSIACLLSVILALHYIYTTFLSNSAKSQSDTSIIVSNPNLVEFKNNLISALQQLNTWFNINLLSLNYNKTQFIQFRTTNNQMTQLDISYNNRYIPNDTNTRFLGITVDSSLSWKQHIDNLMVKFSTACYAIRSWRPFISHESLRMIYFCFHTVMSYGIIFWGNTLYSNNIFKLQKRVIRIITKTYNHLPLRWWLVTIYFTYFILFYFLMYCFILYCYVS
jgi:hypothetical protein